MDVAKKGIEFNLKENTHANSDSKIILDGILLSGSNPYFIIWWTSVGIVLLYEAYNLFGYLGVIIFTIGNLLADLSWYMLISSMVSKSKGILPQKSYKIIAILLCFALVAFGTKYLINGFQLIFKYI